MRLARLSLDKYGHLTDVTLDLPARAPDLFVVLGANEAGKSTTQAAIADFLFGFPHHTDYAYRHAAPDLRVGARIESDGRPLEVWRKKGRVDTLLGADGTPVGEAPLAALLAGIDREAFQQQFSLSHERLREGGQAILKADSDLGRLLFQAGAGLDWLGGRLDALEGAAGGLFKPRGQTQTVNAALKRRTDAVTRQREATVSERAYDEARRAVDEAQAARDRDAALYESLHAQRVRLERVRRVSPVLRRLDVEMRERADLDDLPAVPADMRDILTDAVRGREEAERTLARATEGATRAGQALEAITVDEALLTRADEITVLLDTPRARFVAAEEDLPKREAERDGLAADVQDRAAEVGVRDLTMETVPTHRPTRARMVALRRLAERQALLVRAVEEAEARMEAGRRDLERVRTERDAVGPVPDTAALVAALEAATDDLSAGLDDRLTKARQAVADLRDDIARRRIALVPPLPPGVARAALPSTAVAEAAALALDAAAARLKDLRQSLEALDQERAEKDRQRRDLLDRGGAVPLDRLTQARARRDRGWALVRRRLVDGSPADDAVERAFAGARSLVDVFGEAMLETDRVADARFAAHKTSAQVSLLDTDLRALAEKRAALDAALTEAEAARRLILEDWRAAWVGTGVAPLDPAAMGTWLTALEGIEALAVDLSRAEADLDHVEARADHHGTALGAALEVLEAGGDPTETLTARARRAQRLKADLDKRGVARDRAEDALRRLTEAEEEAGAAHAAALRALAAWRRDWADALRTWALPEDTPPEAVDPVLDAWDGIGKAFDTIAGPDGLDHRIETMREDQARFRDTVADLVAAVAPDLADHPPLRAAQALGERLKTAETQGSRREDAIRRLQESEQAVQWAREDRAHAEEALAAVLARLGVDTVEAAAPVLDRLDQRAHLDRTLRDGRAALLDGEDGRTEADLRAEVAALEVELGAEVNADALAARLETVAEDERRAFDAVQRQSEALAEQRATLEGYHRTGAVAAEAAEDAEQALTEVLRGAERYVRLRATAGLLRHAVSNYRAANEAPLLGRAGTLFDMLTLGRYAGLVVDREDPERPTLRARAAEGGATVPVPGLSDGTRDQMFLALRLAGLEALLDRGTRLPFIADDLFVHFDDARAAAGLRVLSEVAARTQVLVFTHHRHLVDLAEATIPGRFGLLEIGGSAGGVSLT